MSLRSTVCFAFAREDAAQAIVAAATRMAAEAHLEARTTTGVDGVIAGRGEDIDVDMRLETRLRFACGKGRLEEAKSAVRDGARGTVVDSSGYTPLIAACGDGHLHVVRWLVDCVPGVAATVADTNPSLRSTPFRMACSRGHLAVAKFLYESIAATRSTVAKASKSGSTPFSAACNNGCLSTVQWLYNSVPEARETVSLVDNSGISPFNRACMNGHLDVAQWLYESVPEMRSTALHADNAGWTPVMAAIVKGRLPVLQWLHASFPECKDEMIRATPDGDTPFLMACWGGNVELLQWMYESMPGVRAGILQANDHGDTPLAVASKQHSTVLLRWLVSLPESRPYLLSLEPSQFKRRRWAVLSPYVQHARTVRAAELACLVRNCGQERPIGQCRRELMVRIPRPAFQTVVSMLVPTSLACD